MYKVHTEGLSEPEVPVEKSQKKIMVSSILPNKNFVKPFSFVVCFLEELWTFISTSGGRLCQPHYYWFLRFFRSSYGPDTYIVHTYMAPLLQLVSLNKRSAMLLDRLMYNLKEIMKKPPGKDGTSDKESSVNLTFHEGMITAS